MLNIANAANDRLRMVIVIALLNSTSTSPMTAQHEPPSKHKTTAAARGAAENIALKRHARSDSPHQLDGFRRETPKTPTTDVSEYNCR